VTPPSEPSDAELIDAARAARARAYCPYSGFAVGAALRTAEGRIVTGANVENASFSLTICAERAAVARALAEGQTGFVTLAVATGAAEPALPCGACRQVLAEFAPDLRVLVVGEGPAVVEASLADLLPGRFRLPGSG
jgi:homotetrameric cytidine deaminase